MIEYKYGAVLISGNAIPFSTSVKWSPFDGAYFLGIAHCLGLSESEFEKKIADCLLSN